MRVRFKTGIERSNRVFAVGCSRGREGGREEGTIDDSKNNGHSHS